MKTREIVITYGLAAYAAVFRRIPSVCGSRIDIMLPHVVTFI
jgi:hypothetical protein